MDMAATIAVVVSLSLICFSPFSRGDRTEPIPKDP